MSAAAPPPWAEPVIIAARRPDALARQWEDRALCRGLEHDAAARLFFPTRSAGSTQAAAERTTVDTWCARCPVNTDCVAANITEQEGVFGSTPAQRRALRRALERLGHRTDRPAIDPRVGLPRSNSAIRAAKARA